MRKHTIKSLSLLLLVAVGVMAVSASAAQAGYVLLRNEAPVDLLTLEGSGGLGVLLAESGVDVHCDESTFSAHAENLPKAATVDVTAEILFESCSVVGNTFCKVGSSAGAEDEHIFASGSGQITGHEKDEKEELTDTYFGTAESESFATIYFDGVFCTLPESEVVSGSVRVSVLDAENEASTHAVHVEDEELFLGESVAHLDGGEGTLEDEGDGEVSIHLG